MRAVREGLFDYLTKPFENLEELEAVIAKALEMDRAYREIADLRELFTSRSGDPIIISHSLAMEKLLVQLRQAAPLDTTVLIEGESGTGKEVIAKLLHSLSARTRGPMKELNCGALSESLIEAALFGYEKGAFTGAAKTTPGYFEEAHNGTILLDEIADMSPKLQVSLLRVLQEGTFVRLGSTVQRPSNFRLICATNKPLDAEVAAGRFRSDLFYRINVVPLRVPPLRDRREDILPLALVFPGPFQPQIQQGRRAPAARCGDGPGGRALAGQCARAQTHDRTRRGDQCRRSHHPCRPGDCHSRFGCGRSAHAATALSRSAPALRAQLFFPSPARRRRQRLGGIAPFRHCAPEHLRPSGARRGCHEIMTGVTIS